MINTNSDDIFIKEILQKEIDRVDPPSVEEAWLQFENRYAGYQKNQIRHPQIKWSIAVLLIISVLILYQPLQATAFGNTFIKTVKDFFTGETTKNRQITYSLPNQPQSPTQSPIVKELDTPQEREVSIEEAEKTVPYIITQPSYLPVGTSLYKVFITPINNQTCWLRLEYQNGEKYLRLRERNLVGQMSMGILYDTDNTKIKDIEINGKKEQLFEFKNGEINLNWMIRGLDLELSSNLPENEVLKIIKSIK